jgi:hypothetical protein
VHFIPLPYLDPGSGSILIQLILAALLGLGVFIRSQWSRIKKLLGIKSEQVNEEDEENDNTEQ